MPRRHRTGWFDDENFPNTPSFTLMVWGILGILGAGYALIRLAHILL